MDSGKEFVFLDRKGVRWMLVRIVVSVLSLFALIGFVIFLQALLVRPDLRLPPSLRDLKSQLRAVQNAWPSAHPNPRDRLWQQYPTQSTSLPQRQEKLPRLRVGWVAKWDPDSLISLKKHAAQLSHVCTEMYSLTDLGGKVGEEDPGEVREWAEKLDLKFMPVLNNLEGDQWQSDAVEILIRSAESKQKAWIEAFVERLEKDKANGVVLDWQELDPQYAQELSDFVARFSTSMHAHKLELWICVPVGLDLKEFDLQALAASADHLVAQLHDENAERDEPGPVASQPWFEGWLKILMAYGKPEQWIVSIATYGYDWTKGRPQAETISFSDAMARAGRGNVPASRILKPLYNPSFFYEEAGELHTVWFLDAVTFWNQREAVMDFECGGIMINRLGLEDLGIWEILEAAQEKESEQDTLRHLAEMNPGETLTHVGRGDFLEVDLSSKRGARRILRDKDGRLTSDYTIYPHFNTLYHRGWSNEDEIALTFDDGPDPDYTPAILDILARYHVKAAFFVVGRQAEKYPDLIRRMEAEGHEVGSHTYTHPNLGEVPRQQVILELNATQRLIEWLTGRSTLLFRPPYNADVHPENLEEILPMEIAQSLGYITVCESIDPEDWQKPPADELLQRVRDRRAQGNILLLHDAGGDRSQTVKALPAIIEYLQARGDRIVPLGGLLGQSRESLMPPVSVHDPESSRLVSNFGLMTIHWLEEFFWAFMIVATGLTVLRSLVIAWMAYRHHRREQRQVGPSEMFAPPISVVVAAYNEEKVIASTLRSIFDTDYPGPMEVVLVDDGSRDGTAEVVRKLAAEEPRLKLIVQDNGGKASALAHGIREARHEVIVFLDADTQFVRDTLRELVQPLRNEKVGAVSGHALVGNPRTWIARFQALEYVCGFNLDRRAYDSCNAITVAPGAVSAFRREAIASVGGIAADTLAEDTDLTLALHRGGWRVAYTSKAVAWTEAPEHVQALAKQRFRWAFGTMQCLWKHRDMLFNARYGWLGWFSLPGICIFQILLVATIPLVDGLLLLSLLGGAGGVFIWYFVAFLLADLLLAFLACAIEEEKPGKALLILPMRFFYRPLLAFVVWKSILHILRGVWVGWGKLERRGSVVVPKGGES